MTSIPLILRLKKEAHKNTAKAQDIVVETLYEIIDDAVLHGGTAIWRCYHGNRFSEDIDAYIPRNIEKINLFFSRLEKKGFLIQKKKISENSIYSALFINNTFVRFEAIFKRVKGALKEYETADSNFIAVYTLTPEEFINEKVSTYLGRGKIRDLYDVFFLLRYAHDFNEITKSLKHLVKNYQKPEDESDLKVLILEGIIPDSDKMLNYIKNILNSAGKNGQGKISG